MSDAMQAGPELDRLVAEKVMGWIEQRFIRRHESRHQWSQHGPILDAVVRLNPGETIAHVWSGGTFVDVGNWRPSTDIAHAWEVVEKIGGEFVSVRLPGGRWMAGTMEPGSYLSDPEGITTFGCIDGNVLHAAVADTAPLAICRAALKAVSA